MYGYLLCVICSLCILPLGVRAEDCSKAVLAKRQTYNVPVGGSLSLSCIVQHCGDTWSGSWIWKNSTDDTFRTVEATVGRHLTSVELSPNEIQLGLDLANVTKLDEGSYGCSVQWSQGAVDKGHLTDVNVTAAVSIKRTLLHRILICAGATLCLPIVLGLVRCLSSKVKPQPLPRMLNPVPSHFTAAYQAPQHQNPPQPLPRRPVPQKPSTSSRKVPAPVQPKHPTEVVYADISQDALQRQQQQAVRQPDQSSTVYSSVRFA